MELLIHCAYDMTLTRRSDIKRVNVEGTRRLLRAAADAGVPRVIVLSSMSAYEGTTQMYGQAKLAIEGRRCRSVAGCSARPRIRRSAGGMIALTRVTRLPSSPFPSADAAVHRARG